MTAPEHPPGVPPPPAPGPAGVPPGPGVRPPFAAAPVEGRTARLWLSLGVTGGLLAVCCGLGTVALGGFVVTGIQAVNERAHRAVEDYLDAVIEEDWQQAYQELCPADRQEETLDAFTRRVSALPEIQSYRLGDFDFATGELPTDLTYPGGQSVRVRIPLEQTSTGELEVCGFDR